MNDNEIIGLYFQRDERAILETQQKYSKLLTSISYNVLGDRGEAEECVNDTFLAVWNKIPPEKPVAFSAYLVRIVKNHSIDLYRRKNSEKRKASAYSLSLDELSECVSGNETPEEHFTKGELSRAIDDYLRTIPQERRRVFILRYFYCDSLTKISSCMGIGTAKIKSMLFRERQSLREYLMKEGIDL